MILAFQTTLTTTTAEVIWGDLRVVFDRENNCIGIMPLHAETAEFTFMPKPSTPGCDFAPSALTQHIIVYQPDKIWNCCAYHESGGNHTLSCSPDPFEDDDHDPGFPDTEIA